MKKILLLVLGLVVLACTNNVPLQTAVKQGGVTNNTPVQTKSIDNSKFQGINYLEKKVIGISMETSGMSYEDRIGFLEDRIIGNRSNDNILIRQRKLYDLVFLDGSYYSLNTKVDNLEDYIFQERDSELDLQTRIEKIEEYLYSDRKNGEALLDRINDIYSYLLITDKDFIKKGQFLKREIGVIEIRTVRNYGSLEVGEILEFNLEKDIEGIAKTGSLVIGKVISKTTGGLFTDEKVTIVLGKIINQERREISIYKKIELEGNVQRIFGGKYVRIDNMVIIG
ncbi:MAG: hypothetical protein PWP46_405 [Fusobacteriaceae bacterium]|jgi:hypothetical protein|nr:hypothetical protein [Fusobacteriales bacterium]MDN5303526.1 hypothetical protein [Fusobacteriaceae bacterium]